MTKPNNGGPAFPQSDVLYEDGAELVRTAHGGMTLRDYFAGQANEDDIDYYRDYYHCAETSAIVSKYTRSQARYRFADAMLRAREE